MAKGWPTKQKFDDGDKIFLQTDKVEKVQLLEDEPELYYTHYVNGKSHRCNGEDCAMCIGGEKKIEKGSMKVKDMADSKEKSLVGTSALFLTLHETLEMCGGRKGFVFSIKATGQKQQRRYHIVPLPVAGQQMISEVVKEEESTPF